MQSARQMLHILQHNCKLDLNAEKLKVIFIYHCAITLPVTQPPTSEKQQKATKNLHRMLGWNMQQENVGSAKKKDVEGEIGSISAQMLMVYVV